MKVDLNHSDSATKDQSAKQLSVTRSISLVGGIFFDFRA